MEFHSPETSDIKKHHEEQYPDFPWEFAYEYNTMYAEWIKDDVLMNSSQATHAYKLEYIKTEEFRLYLNFEYVLSAYCKNYENIASGQYPSNFLKAKWILEERVVRKIHIKNMLGYKEELLFVHKPTLRTTWIMKLLKSGYKVNDLLKSAKSY